MEVEPYLPFLVLIRVGLMVRNDKKCSRLLNPFQVPLSSDNVTNEASHYIFKLQPQRNTKSFNYGMKL